MHRVSILVARLLSPQAGAGRPGFAITGGKITWCSFWRARPDSTCIRMPEHALRIYRSDDGLVFRRVMAVNYGSRPNN